MSWLTINVHLKTRPPEFAGGFLHTIKSKKPGEYRKKQNEHPNPLKSCQDGEMSLKIIELSYDIV